MSRKRLWTGLVGTIAAMLSTTAFGQTTRYVDQSAPPGGNGTSWNLAYRDLQLALAAAAPNSGDTILVAKGKYRPTLPNGIQTVSFALKSGVTVRGGYPGYKSPNQNARDVDGNETILSGDLNLNDDPSIPASYDDNSYHVVKNVGVGSTAILDGFTISGGRADVAGDGGGGMRNEQSSPMIVDCTFEDNQTLDRGGAVFNQKSSPTFVDCVFRENVAQNDGGAMYNTNQPAPGPGSSPMLVRCDFIANSSSFTDGGAIHNFSLCFPKLFGCRFLENTARFGGALYGLATSDVEMTNCLFVGNSAAWGGAVYELAQSRWANCTFVANDATTGRGGGAYLVSGAVPEVSNSIFWGNTDSADAAGTSEPAQIFKASGAGIVIDYCIVAGWTQTLDTDPTHVHCSGADPLFQALPSLPGNHGNLRLGAGSPGIDAGNGCLYPINDPPTDFFDLDSDGNFLETPPRDLDGNPRYADCPQANTGALCGHSTVIDRGCYEACSASCQASAVFRNAGTNPASLSVTQPVLGTTFTATVNLALTGHTHARVFAFDRPANVPYLNGVLLVDRSSPQRFVSLPLAGPTAVFQIPIPADPALCGLTQTVQAKHVSLSGNPRRPPMFSNAYDLVFGY